MGIDERASAMVTLLAAALIAGTASVGAQWKVPSPRGVTTSPATSLAPVAERRDDSRRASAPAVAPDRIGDALMPTGSAHGSAYRSAALGEFGDADYDSPGPSCGSWSWLGAAAGATQGAMTALVMTSLSPLPPASRNQLFVGLTLGGALTGALQAMQACAMSSRVAAVDAPLAAQAPMTAAVPRAVAERTVVHGSAFRLETGTASGMPSGLP